MIIIHAVTLISASMVLLFMMIAEVFQSETENDIEISVFEFEAKRTVKESENS